MSGGEAFVWLDRYLDTIRTGPQYLRMESVAQTVADALRRGVDIRHYDLHAWCIMPNHVHVLLTPCIAASRLLQLLKGVTAREANKLLGRTGEPFWQAESYDHWVRNETEFDRIAAYIENNPVKAGLVTRASEYHWSSAGALDTSVEAAG